MCVSHSIPVFTPRQQFLVSLTGLVTVLTVGIAACFLLTLACLWIVVHLALLMLQASLEVLTSLATTYATADPLARVLLLVALTYVVYRVSFHARKKGTA